MKLIVQTMTVADAVKAMREAGIKTGPDRVMAGIEQGVYPWGDCIKMRSPEYTVYRKMFEQWLKERGETVEPDEGAAGGEVAV